jgi:DNA-directed RNA polymerase sigma subunit (sigma70/sigma32)
VILEGNVGLMRAIKRFEPDKGFRLATYATLWIKAATHVIRFRASAIQAPVVLPR